MASFLAKGSLILSTCSGKNEGKLSANAVKRLFVLHDSEKNGTGLAMRESIAGQALVKFSIRRSSWLLNGVAEMRAKDNNACCRRQFQFLGSAMSPWATFIWLCCFILSFTVKIGYKLF